jgi:DNA-binding MarR family transcriptional regulator
MKLLEVQQAVEETYLVADKGVIKLLVAIIVAHRMPTPPVWLFLVGASGSGKTEFINILTKIMGVTALSSLTPQTFISGQKRGKTDPSLLSRIKNGILLMKDFTTILAMNYEARAMIMGQMREIYDGKFIKHFGTGDSVVWEGKISLIAGTTDEIYNARELYAAMGERFIMYCPHLPERKTVTRRAMGNVIDMDHRRDLISTIVKKYIDEHLSTPPAEELPKTPDDLKSRIIDLADFATLARSPVKRDSFSPSKEIIYKNDPEMPTRFAAQLETICLAFMLINKFDNLGEVVLPEDEDILYKLALDSITVTRRQVMRKLTEYESVSTSALAEDMNYPVNTIRRWLEDLNALGIVNVEKARTHAKREDMWTLKQAYRDIITRYEGVKQKHESLSDEPKEPQETIPLEQFEAELEEAELPFATPPTAP